MNPNECTLADFKGECGAYVRVIGEAKLAGDPEPTRVEVEVDGRFVPLMEVLAAYECEKAIEEVAADA